MNASSATAPPKQQAPVSMTRRGPNLAMASPMNTTSAAVNR